MLSDPENAPKWSLNTLEEKLTSPRPVGVGSTRRAVIKRLGGGTMENHAVCTEFERNRKLTWQSTSSPIPFRVALDFTPIDGSTQIDSTWTWEPRSFLRPASPVLDLMFKRAMRRDVENLKALMEAGEL